MMTRYTVLGASGFVGSHLVTALQQQHIEPYQPSRGEVKAGESLGVVFYCIGLTSDFRTRPFATVEAHVEYLSWLLQNCAIDKILYLSSTRVYQHCPAPVDEDAVIGVTPNDPDHLYNLSKLMGESLTLHSPVPGHVVRLSNVYGGNMNPDTFLSQILRSALIEHRIVLQSGLDSEKNYVFIDDVVTMLIAIAQSGQFPIYNLVADTNTTHRDILAGIQVQTGCEVVVKPNAKSLRFPAISNARLKTEFDFQPHSLLEDLPGLIQAFNPYS